MANVKLGFVPTRRSIFSAPDAIKYRGLTADRFRELEIDFVDITDINEEGLLYDDNDVDKIVAKFKAEGVDGIMLAHCNFGTEYVCARLAKKLGLPVLLWGPLDESPEPDGVRLRDTQCGLFATGNDMDFIKEIDIYTLFANLMDNAIEASEHVSEEKRYIEVVIKTQKKFLSIHIENYFSGEIYKRDGRIMTIKPDKDYHGFGVSSMKQIVEKYQGDMAFNTSNQIFKVNILFPIPENGDALE